MIEITQTSQNYAVTNESSNYKLTMTATVSKNQTMPMTANGTFTDLEGLHLGNFNYSEDVNGKVSKSFYSIDKKDMSALETLLDDTITQFNANVNDNE